ncbi:MAG: hypothetical protein AAFY66_03795, partial [Pseudomonadota bacterium]
MLLATPILLPLGTAILLFLLRRHPVHKLLSTITSTPAEITDSNLCTGWRRSRTSRIAVPSGSRMGVARSISEAPGRASRLGRA